MFGTCCIEDQDDAPKQENKIIGKDVHVCRGGPHTCSHRQACKMCTKSHRQADEMHTGSVKAFGALGQDKRAMDRVAHLKFSALESLKNQTESQWRPIMATKQERNVRVLWDC